MNIRRKPLLILSVVIAVLLMASVAGVLYMRSESNKRQQAALLEQDKAKYAAASNEANLLVNQLQYESAADRLQSYIDESIIEKNKFSANLKLAAVYEMSKNYKKAYELYQKLSAASDDNSSKLTVAMGYARSAEALGKKSEAIESYRILAEYHEKSDKLYDKSEAKYYRNKITTLESAP